MAPYRYEFTVRFRDTDAAGILYFANQFEHAHAALEQYCADHGQPLQDILKTESYLLPIVHAEADYHRSLTLGDRVLVEVRLVRLGTTSFTIDYQLIRTDGVPVGHCRMVHVAIDKVDRKKVPLPDAVKELLAPLPQV